MWRKTDRYLNARKLYDSVVVITGANRGIGKETLLDIIERGAKVRF